MCKTTVLALFFFLMVPIAMAQQEGVVFASSQATVVPFDDEKAIEKGFYWESPYYHELHGVWKQRQTDSSIIYSRQINVEKYWKDYRVFLYVRASHASRVYMGGKEVSYGDDSRHWNEFGLNGFLKYGKQNTLVVEVLKRSHGDLLESDNEDVGLNGEPYLIFRNDPSIAGYSVTADYDVQSQSGKFTLDAGLYNSRKKGKYYFEVEIYDPNGRSFDRMGRWVVFDKKATASVTINQSFSRVDAWTAETPALYTVVFRLRNEDMDVEEMTGCRVGFRHLEVHEGNLQLNGRAITLKGVVYDKEHGNDHASREQMREALQSMKNCNINAIRTDRYSPQVPCFYDMCDEMGFYVICDANLFPLSTQHKAAATDPNLAPLFEKRVENLYSVCGNHPSILAWSLGNTRDNGVCMGAAYRRLKGLDGSRPVLFAGAGLTETTDLLALINPNAQTLQQYILRRDDRPSLVLSAPAADYDLLWDKVESHRSLQGGFLAVWPLQGTLKNDIRALYSPFDVSVIKQGFDEVEFAVYNRNVFTSLSQYNIEYTIYTNLRSNISSGDVAVAVGGGDADKVTLRIPPIDMRPGEEMFVRFDLVRRPTQRVARIKGDRQVSMVTFPLNANTTAKRPFKIPSDLSVPADSVKFSYSHELMLGERWVSDTIDARQRRSDGQFLCRDYMLRFRAPEGGTMCDARVTETLYGTGDVVVDYTLFPSDLLRHYSLHPAVRVNIPSDSVQWFGNDRETFFRRPRFTAVNNLSHAADSLVRHQVRWCAANGGGKRLFMEVLGTPFTMTATKDYTILSPHDSLSFRVHLVEVGDGHPADFYGNVFPVEATGMVESPAIHASASRFSDPMEISIVSASNTTIRYTLDGSDPTPLSPLYHGPFVITATTVVKARAYTPDGQPSFSTTRKLNYDYVSATSFSRKPNTPYNIGTDTILFDGERGSIDDFNHGWLGFSGDPVTVHVTLSKPIAAHAVMLRFAHSPATWAFAPQRVMVARSLDGVAYSDTVVVDLPFDAGDENNRDPRVVEVMVPLSGAEAQHLAITAVPLGVIPTWHRAKGLKPWLMMDELEVSDSQLNETQPTR